MIFLLVFKILFCLLSYSIPISSNSIDLIHRNLSDFSSFDHFYRAFLRDIREHRTIDTVASPINLEKIRLNNYTADDIKNSVDKKNIYFEKEKHISFGIQVLWNSIRFALCTWLQSKDFKSLENWSSTSSTGYFEYSRKSWMWTTITANKTISVTE